MDKTFINTSIALYESDAFLFMQVHPFLFTDKTVHPFYIDCSKLQEKPVYWKSVIEDLSDIVGNNVDTSKINRISGGESRDLLFSIPVAQKFQLPHVILRKERKTYGNATNIAGAINKGDYVVHIADLLTQATSAIKWIEEIEAHGATIDSYFVVFDRNQGGREKLANRQPSVIVHSLAQMTDDFFEIGIEQGKLKPDLYSSIKESYLLNPRAWGINFLREHPAETAIILETDGVGLLVRGYPEMSGELLELARPYLKNPDYIERLVTGKILNN